MKKIFWFALGIGATAFVMVKGKKILHRLTPAGMSEQVAERGRHAMGNVRAFWSDFTEAMDERETELRNELNLTPKN